MGMHISCSHYHGTWTLRGISSSRIIKNGLGRSDFFTRTILVALTNTYVYCSAAFRSDMSKVLYKYLHGRRIFELNKRAADVYTSRLAGNSSKQEVVKEGTFDGRLNMRISEGCIWYDGIRLRQILRCGRIDVVCVPVFQIMLIMLFLLANEVNDWLLYPL